MKTQRILLIIVSLLILLSACQPSPEEMTEVVSPPENTQEPTPSSTTPPTVTNTVTQTDTPSPVPSFTTTNTPVPTHTPTPTPTPIPWGSIPIIVQNGSQVVQISVWGKGTADSVYSADNGNKLLVLTPFGLYVYDNDSKKLLTFFEDAEKVVISPDTTRLAVSFPEGFFQLWDAAGLTLLFASQHQIETPKFPPPDFNASTLLAVESMAFSHDNELLAVGYGDRVIKLFQIESGQLLKELNSQLSPLPRKLLFTPDRQYLINADQGRSYGRKTIINVGLWDVESGEIIGYYPDSGLISDYPINPEGTMMVASKWGGFVYKYRIPDGQVLGTFGTGAVFPWVEFSTDGEHLLINGGAQVRKLVDGTQVIIDQDALDDIRPRSLTSYGHLSQEDRWALAHMDNLYFLRVVNGDSIAAWGHENQTTFRWDVYNHSITKYEWDVRPRNLAISSDEKYLATCTYEYLLLMPTINQQVQNLGNCDQRGLAFSPDNSLLAKTFRKKVDIISIPSGELIHNMRGHIWSALIIQYSLDGEYLLSSNVQNGGGEIIMWRNEPASKLRLFKVSAEYLRDLALAPDASYLVTADDNIRYWRVSDGWQELFLPIQAYKLAISPLGNLVAAGDGEGNIFLLSLPEGEEIAVLAGHRDRITDLIFTGDGRNLISTSYDGTVRMWGIVP